MEDHPDLRDLARFALEHDGFAVRVAEHGRAALDLLADFRPCVILLDLMLPVMDGWAFVAAYRALPHADARLIVMTAGGDVARQATALGAHGWLGKPYDLDDLSALADRHCRAHRPA